ncbi:alpha/beta hydrolase family protein [Brevundimonas sp.]|uniref:alpha/beta hydrolase family protein n=1 Tax=Brevundimonas sp. TaxID=1871086 RepID=UPI002D657D19|nr:alpha/beta fold hydrolase [Brevundimonas sp.]HYC68247.1 alpha/beta fold hydrolase [Brevundimonas sp.]
MLRILLAVMASFVLLASSARAQTPPIEAYAALPAISMVEVSPDGSTLAYLRRDGASTKVVVQTRTGELLAAVETGALRVSELAWASPDHVVVGWLTSEHFPLGGYKGRFMILDVLNVRTQSYERVLKRADHNAYTSIFDWRAGTYRDRPALFVTAPTYEEGDLTFDVYRVDLDTGRGFRMHRGDSDTRGYVLAQTGEAVARTAYQADSGFWRLSSRTGAGWREIYTETALLDGPGLGGLGRTPDTLVLARKEGDRGYIYSEIALADGSVRETFDFAAQPDGFFHDSSGKLVAVGWTDTYRQYRFFEPALQTAFDTLSEVLPGRQLQLVSFSDDYSVVAFYVEGSGESGGYYVYDAARQRVSVVGRSYPGVPGEAMAEVRAVRYAAADGRQLMGYLTLPPGRESRDLPVVVMPHGGPAARDYAGYDWMAQAFASRGYAVFQPQFRGSDGFGLDLLEAGYGEWGRKMQSDVSDGLRYLVEQDVVDADRACIVGWSYGGYAALAGMTLEAGAYRCGVSIAGVSDLREMLREEERQGDNEDRNPAVRYWKRFMGASSTSDSSLDERSPARLAARARGPILLIHGRDDLTVPFRQSQMMLEALGGESERARLIALPGQDHSVLQNQAERTRLLRETVAFLEAHNPPR